MIHQQGLRVQLAVGAGGGVAHVAHGDVAPAQLFQLTVGEDLAHQARVPVGPKKPVVVDGDAGALLSPVLQGKKAAVDERRQIPLFRRPDAEDAAFLPGLAFLTHPLSPGGP